MKYTDYFNSDKQMTSAKCKNIAKNYISGRLRFAQFAITNACMARCSFCDIWRQQPKVFVDKEKTLIAIDKLADLGVSHLIFTGGDPLNHKDTVAFVERAAQHNIHTMVLNAAPRLLLRRLVKNYRPDEYIVKQLDNAGCDIIAISFDSGDPETMEEQRQLPNLMAEMTQAMKILKTTNIKTAACVLIWDDNYDKIEDVCERATNMGFDLICFNYPTFSNSEVYPLGGKWVSLSNENVITGLKKVIQLKKEKKYNIVNEISSMENIINYLQDPASAKFSCYGGQRTLFVDWFFDVHPCMQVPDTIGNIFTLEEKDLVRPHCNECNMSWFRDLSMYFNDGHSISDVASSVLKLI
ncbi:radical SAM protein [Alkalibaculum sporogenes]|nr:radical SAM protein [Alkalibaculum sporogenes]